MYIHNRKKDSESPIKTAFSEIRETWNEISETIDDSRIANNNRKKSKI